MKALLIHGQGRTRMSMLLLGWRLKRRGYAVSYFGYATWLESFDKIVERFAQTIRYTMGEQPYVIVAHSLGGIIARASLPYLTDNPPQRLVMLAPPNQPPLMGKLFRSNPVYRLFTRDCGHKLAEDTFYKKLPRPAIPTTIIAGTRGLPKPLSPFAGETNDMVLAVSETRLEGLAEPILVRASHPFIMNSKQVAEIIFGVLADRPGG
jgi:hypothetical protein